LVLNSIYSSIPNRSVNLRLYHLAALESVRRLIRRSPSWYFRTNIRLFLHLLTKQKFSQISAVIFSIHSNRYNKLRYFSVFIILVLGKTFKMKILIVEDDELVAEALAAILTNQNYAVEIASDGQSAWELIENYDYDLLLLDVILPKHNGISLCRQIRSKGLQMPILLLTGRDSSHDKAIGLDAGADDYLVKPFDQEELVARVRALLRRGGVTSQPVLEWGELRLDPTSCEVNYGTQLLPLTPKEYALLELFLRNSRRVFSCGMILEHLWSYEDTPGEEAVRTHIKGLRQKLKAAGASGNLIETVYGIGYRLKPQEEKNGARDLLSSGQLTTSSQNQKSQQTLVAVTGIWQKFKGRVLEQINILEQAAIALTQKALNQELHSQAKKEAHTLAGSLGTFGFAEGSKLALHIEKLLKSDKILDEADATKLSALVKALLFEIKPNPEENQETPTVEQNERSLLLVVDKDSAFAEQLAQESGKWGLEVVVASSISTARNKLYQEHPKVVLLDPSVSTEDEDSLKLLAEFSDRKPPVPVLVFSERNNLSDRLQIARSGGTIFLQKPIPPAQVLEAVTQVLQQSDLAQVKVLAVDDDPKILALLQSLLTPWGLTVKTLSDPQKLWETLEAVKPDLLILDVEMPEVSGIELCQVLRKDSRWSELPILFLTVHNDTNIVNQVFSVGADDFVSKPFVGPELVTRIINRLERMKLVRMMAQTQQVKNNTESENRWRAIFDAEPECVKIIDADGTLLEMNPGGLAMLEAENASAVIGKSVYSMIQPEYRQAFKELNQSVCQGNKGSLEFEIITDKGNHRWLETYGVPLRYKADGTIMQLAITRDITARKQIEADLHKSKDDLALRVSERNNELIRLNDRLQLELNERQRTQAALQNSQIRLAGIVEIADDAIISIDANQRITLFNQGAEKIFGFQASEVLGRPLNILLPLRCAEAHRHHVAEFSTSEAQARRMGERRQIYGKRKDGTEFPAEASISKLELGDDTIYTVYLQDVSERRQIEQMKDEFVSVVSHELRTPLTSIHGSLGMLSSGLIKAESEQGKRLLQIATDSTDRLVRLINDILDIERIESGKVKMEKQTCDVGQLVTQAVNLMQQLADKAGITLSITSLSSKFIWADSDRIIQTLTNLLSNAIKFSSSGDTVCLEVQQQGEEVVFAVKDQGRGIPSDKLETIFERFQQIDASDSRRQDGTGLGLAICKSIVQQHNGRIWVESTAGKGSIFYFTVPESKSVQTLELESSVSNKGVNVLVCDDDPSIRTQLKRLLEQKGYQVSTVNSGEGAIATAASQHPDIILLDLVMPGMNGWEVMAILKQRKDTENIPIIICSVCEPNKNDQLSQDFAQWVCKPVEDNSLLRSLSQVLANTSKKLRILLVEDDAKIAELLVTLLESHGIKTFLAQTGKEAIRKSQEVNPDLIILDIVLPECDGFTVVEWLQQHHQLNNIPLLVYSAKDLDDSERDKLKLGDTEFLTKGKVTIEEFEQRVMGLLQRITPNSEQCSFK
jgi:PAS domain S-box-containing protein